MAVIELNRLTKTYGRTTAVAELTLTVPPGRVTGFVGPNGAGKTTTLRMLLGLTRPSSGTALIGGKQYRDLVHPVHSVGAMVDPNVFHPNRSGRNALRVIAQAAAIRDERVDDVLGLVGLSDAASRRAGGYSMGMRQRLALAAALLGDPETLVLDEPANGLDPHGIHWLRGLIRDMAAEGRTVFVSSHLLAELAQTVDDVVIIADGRLVRQQPIADLAREANHTSLEDLYLRLTETQPRPLQASEDLP